MAPPGTLYLGATRRLDSGGAPAPLYFPAYHLVTHGVVVGMTGSGKTGLVTVLAEEALRSGVPPLVVDVKGDLTNPLLRFPDFGPEALLPWVDSGARSGEPRSPAELAAALASQRRDALTPRGFTDEVLRRYVAGSAVRVLTPGGGAGEPLHVLSGLERRSARWDRDLEAARAALSAALSLVLRLVGRSPEPARSRDHVLLSVLAERRLAGGEPATLDALLADLITPPVDRIGALSLDDFLPRTQRKALAAALNGLLASPTFQSWRQGATLDVGGWPTLQGGRTLAVVVSVAHVDDDERELVLRVLLEGVLSWVRTLPGGQCPRARLPLDEIYGFLPPHLANPPTKRPLVALLKQARAFGVGVVVGTRNPMDLDHRAPGNAGVWWVGRLQTDTPTPAPSHLRVTGTLAFAGRRSGPHGRRPPPRRRDSPRRRCRHRPAAGPVVVRDAQRARERRRPPAEPPHHHEPAPRSHDARRDRPGVGAGERQGGGRGVRMEARSFPLDGRRAARASRSTACSRRCLHHVPSSDAPSPGA